MGTLLKIKMCSSSQKLHRDCYESYGLFIKQRDLTSDNKKGIRYLAFTIKQNRQRYETIISLPKRKSLEHVLIK